MENVDFSNLYISEKINVYEYSQTGFTELSEAYVISENENIVSLAYRADQEHYQIMTFLAEKIAETGERSFAVVYDQSDAISIQAKGLYSYALPARRLKQERAYLPM